MADSRRREKYPKKAFRSSKPGENTPTRSADGGSWGGVMKKKTNGTLRANWKPLTNISQSNEHPETEKEKHLRPLGLGRGAGLEKSDSQRGEKVKKIF